ncbi:MAG TPA: hypothetical protein ENI29_05930 [bacterium]|nr:hypothetical protein [bacterium]
MSIVETFESWYFFEKWIKFLKKFDFTNSLFIGSAGFEDRSLSSLKSLINNESFNTNLFKFYFFFLESHSAIDQESVMGLEIKKEADKIDEETLKMVEKLEILKKGKNLNLQIHPFKRTNINEQFIGHEEIYNIIQNDFLGGFPSKVFLDVSAFPRTVFIPLIKILYQNKQVENLFIVWTNKGGLEYEENVSNYDQVVDIPLFSGVNIEKEEMKFWLPILNYNTSMIDLVLSQKQFKTNSSLYPIVTFPSHWPHETNNLLLENKKFFINKTFEIDKVLYLPYNNPFEFFIGIIEFYKSKKKILSNDFTLTISPFGSKAQSIGASLAGILLENVRLTICRPVQYHYDLKSPPKEEESKSFIAWIKEPPK